MITLDQDRILACILALPVSPLAKESGSALADEWMRTWYAHDSQERMLAVENGFVLLLDAYTVAIGVQDLVTQDSIGVLGNEWKSTKEPSRWWNEDAWLKDISVGPQLGLYALALKEAVYYEKGIDRPVRFGVQEPRIRVRACVKSSPPKFWPSDPETGILTFGTAALEAIRQAFLGKAEQIRTLRRRGRVPWQFTGKHCFPFNRTCEFLDNSCSEYKYPVVLEGNDKLTAFDQSDPANELALTKLPSDLLEDERTVVLSASSYTLASECMEKYRIISGSLGGKARGIELEIGTVLHAAIAEMYRQIKAEQDGK